MSSLLMKKKDIIVNAIGGGMTACQCAFLLIVVSRWQPVRIAGIITIGYAVANLGLSLCNYGVRNFQVTDLTEKYSFHIYLLQRGMTCCLAISFSILFLCQKFWGGEYDIQKVRIISEIILLKQLDGIEDVFLGRFQQIDQFYTGAWILAVRQVIVTVLMCLLVLLKVTIENVFFMGILTSASIDIICLSWKFPKELEDTSASEIKNRKKLHKGAIPIILELSKECFPLAVGTILTVYIANVPKYTIDAYATEKTQAVFGYLMLPVFVITLLNQFLYQPFIKKLGDLWKDRLFKLFRYYIIRQCIFVIAITMIFLIACIWIGLPLLSLVYQTDLTLYRTEFVLLSLGGSLYALSYYLTVPITIMRRQEIIAVTYFIVSVLVSLLNRFGGFSENVIWVCWLYIISNGAIMLTFLVYAFTKSKE